MKLAERILNMATPTGDLYEKSILEFGKKSNDDVLGYDAGGNAIMRPKSKAAEKKAIEKVKSEADKFSKQLGGGDDGKSLFLRLMLSVDSDKEAKAVQSDMLKAQKAKTPYVAVKSVPFSLPNFSWKGGVVGDPKSGNSGKFLDNQFPTHDRKYKVLLNNLGKITEIHAATDIVAHDVYMKGYKSGIKIFLYLVNKGDGTFPSDLRIAKAFKKLRDAGMDATLVGKLSDKDQEKAFGKEKNNESVELKLAAKILDSIESIDESVHASQGFNFALTDELNVNISYNCNVGRRHMRDGSFIEEDDIEMQTKIKEVIQADADAFMKAVGEKLKNMQEQL